jgi:hypothetical protein
MGTPTVQLTLKEMAEHNKIVLRLRAAGVVLHGLNWRIVNVDWRPIGFDFMSPDYAKIQHQADASPRMAHDFVDLPGYDPWRAANIKAAGYSELGVPHPVHLDIAVNSPGLCRAYISPRSARLERKIKGAVAQNYKASDAYKEVAKRLKGLDPSIDFAEHIGTVLDVGPSPLEGINFQARDYDRLLACLRNAKDHTGQAAFAEGSKIDKKHVPLAFSFLATDGLGFRQIWRPKPAVPTGPSPLETREDWQRRQFGAHFGDSITVQDLSSLHCAVSRTGCNIHVDNQGFVMVGADGKPILDPNMVRHTLVELFWKTMLQGKLPLWALNRVSFDIPSTPTEFSRAGVSLDLIQGRKYKLTLRGTCALGGDFNASGTLAFSGSF